MTAGPGIRTWARSALGVAALLALAWSAYEGVALGRLSEPLRTPAAPRRIVSLQLAPTAVRAEAIRREWDARGVTPVARRVLARDSRFIAAYVAGWGVLALWAAWTTGLSSRLTAVLLVLVVIGGVSDLAENWLLGITLGNAGELPFARVAPFVPGLVALASAPDESYRHAVTLARLAAMTKFALLLFGVAGTVAVSGGALRLILIGRLLARKATETTAATDGPVAPEAARGSMHDLVRLENSGIFFDPRVRTPDDPAIVEHVAADEPRIQFRAADMIGLSLSGGGIRSATFNLGLLEGLHRLQLLKLFDYVSTVSGGGYVGSFWSEWLARQKKLHGTPIPEERLFPTHRNVGAQPPNAVDTPQERHLREFSGFLAPRWGFFEVESWTAIVAMLAGLLPALLIGLSVIGVGLIAWLSLTFALASHSDFAPALVIVGVTFLILYLFERMWQEFKRESAGHGTGADSVTQAGAVARVRLKYRLIGAASLGLVGAIQLALPHLHAWLFGGPWPLFEYIDSLQGLQAPGDSGLVRWWAVAGIANPRGAWVFSPRLFDFSLAWLTSAAVLVLARMAYPVWPWSWKRETLAAFDRVLIRVLAPGVFWSGIAALWHISINLTNVMGAATAAIASAGIFAMLRNWIGTALRRPAEAGLLDRLKPYLPQVLAYTTIVLTVVVVGGLLIATGRDDWLRWWIAAAVMSTFLVLALFIKPDEFGLHAFYRDRISRAYAGACNLAEGKQAGDNRGTEPRDGDDRELTGLVGRPLHLVCCAANDLTGDQVETLGRGARSAVLSRHGFSLGSHFHQWTALTEQRLGSAVTASAAAFNSNMGQISMRVGPAVSFLMTMLNLRLGLWLRHPAAVEAGARRWPGLLFYREMFGLTSASGAIGAGELPSTYLRDVHLSDGGHFENLALYELIRRHCRYVLVSDCGADPTVAFDDLGNALRRVREDFGVDISVDVSVLRPDQDGRSRQHVAVGTIHYSPTDRGIMLYVKPSLTGDEPTDVLQYQTRNTAFPHEGTGDQFYDEAQWESYRRLGLHAAECIFEFAAREDGSSRRLTADWVFAEASHQWGTTPEGLEERVLEMTKRFGVLEAELQNRSARGILEEIFPEMTYLPATTKPAAVKAPEGVEPPGAADDLPILLRVTQLMEDVWLSCQLDQWWGHPLNLGWINLFARWATSGPFRFWWPVMSPMFSPGFRRFIQDRFPVRAGGSAASEQAADPQRGRVEKLTTLENPGLAAIWWTQRSTQPANLAPYADERGFSRTLYQNVLDLSGPKAEKVSLQVGLVAVTRHGAHAGWTSDDFFVPPSLWGAGIGWYFLKNLLGELSQSGCATCLAVVKLPPAGLRHQVARDDRLAFMQQYRKIGFREQLWQDGAHDGAVDKALCEKLGFIAGQDTLLVLELEQWKGR